MVGVKIRKGCRVMPLGELAILGPGRVDRRASDRRGWLVVLDYDAPDHLFYFTADQLAVLP